MDRLMPRKPPGHAVVAALLLAAVPALPAAVAAETGRFSASIGTLVDDADGTSVDVDLYWEPTTWLSLGAGIGQSESSADLADFNGDSRRASLDVHGDSLGGRLSWRQWQDSGQFDSDSMAAEVYWRTTSGWQFGAIAEQRDFGVDYTVTVLNRPLQRRVEFDGQGFGAQVSWYGDAWGGYLRGVTYDYDETLARVLAAARTPNLARFPRLDSLVTSLLTRSAAAVDHDLAAGIERSFQRSGLRFDVSTTRDSLSGADSRSLSVSYRYSLTPRFELEGTLGSADNDDLDAVGFAGIALSYRN